MARKPAPKRKTPKSKASKRGIVVIERPTSASRTEKTFGITAKRARYIKELVEEAVG